MLNSSIRSFKLNTLVIWICFLQKFKILSQKKEENKLSIGTITSADYTQTPSKPVCFEFVLLETFTCRNPALFINEKTKTSRIQFLSAEVISVLLYTHPVLVWSRARVLFKTCLVLKLNLSIFYWAHCSPRSLFVINQFQQKKNFLQLIMNFASGTSFPYTRQLTIR